MRTFQYSDAKSHKFWNIVVNDTDFTVTYGKIGTTGQTQTKEFPTPDKTQAAAEKLIREKLSKGYVETTPAAVVSDSHAFERGIIENFNDAASWGPYADWLQEQGDPRGEFMAVQLALERDHIASAERAELKKREAALLAAHQATWLGPLAEFTEKPEGDSPPPVEVSFAHGWISRLFFRRLSVNQARALAKVPDIRLLRELVVEEVAYEAPVGSTASYVDSYYEPGPDIPNNDDDENEHPALHVLCRCPHLGNVRVFRLGELPDGTGDPEHYGFNCHTSGELAYHLVKQMPRLEELYLYAHRVDANKIFPLPLPGLRVLHLYHSVNYPLERLANNSSLTNLTVLRCHPHAFEYDDEDGGAYIRLEHLRAICRSAHLSSLTHLCLRLSDFGDNGAKEIVNSGILKRLKVLDLYGGSITDAGAKLLAGCSDLKHLEHLNLRANALTSGGVAALTATGVSVDTQEQHNQTGSEDGDTPEYLYFGDIE